MYMYHLHVLTSVAAPRVSGVPARPGGIGTVSPIPVACGVVASLITVFVRDPVRGTAFGTVGDLPCKINLQFSVGGHDN